MDWVQSYFQMKFIVELIGGVVVFGLLGLLVVGMVLEHFEHKFIAWKRRKKK